MRSARSFLSVIALLSGSVSLMACYATAAPLDDAIVHTDRIGRHHAYWHDPTITAADAREVRLATIVPLGATLVDLTHVFDEETIVWPSESQGFRREGTTRGSGDGHYASGRFSTPEHGGTHLDAPSHFAGGKHTADRVPLPRLMAQAVVLDIEAKAAANPDAQLEPADITAFEERYGQLPRGAFVLVRTGWSERWPDRKRYLGDDRAGQTDALHFPGIAPDAAKLLVEREVGAVGIDTASVDHGPSKSFEAHRTFANADVPTFENVARLGMVPETGAVVIALPMKIGDGSGGPARIVAVVPG
jgi:kynurenine formamidase